MERIKPTRSELLKTKKRIRIAKKGHELLKKKQDSLVMEFFKLLKDIREQREKLQELYLRAQKRMNEARALQSDLRIGSAGLLVQRASPVEIEVKNIAGVHVPHILQNQQAEYSVYGNIILQDLGMAYRRVVEAAVLLSVKETSLRKMLVEIKKTKRRANALEHVLIPKLEKGLHGIQFELDERAREEFNRLKRRKH